jgi:glycosyltransferase involved in cell wall biosynthesis
MAVNTGGGLVSINLPCYRQLHHARRAIDSLRAQTFAHIAITLLDDGASDEYAQYVESLGDSRVVYRRNPERLGAMRNMFAAITAGDGEFTMAFHEDDLLSTTYVAAAMDIFAQDPACGFVACQLREFDRDPSADDLAKAFTPPAFETFAARADLVRGILRGVEPMFGSIIYRRTALAGVAPDHEGYATLVDRPFLLSIMDRGYTAAVIQSPLVWYRHHGEGDTRHLAMTSDHVLHLLRTYRDALPKRWSHDDRTAFFTYSGYWLFELYRLTPPEQRPPVWRYLLRFGIRQMQRALLNQTS